MMSYGCQELSNIFKFITKIYTNKSVFNCNQGQCNQQNHER